MFKKINKEENKFYFLLVKEDEEEYLGDLYL